MAQKLQLNSQILESQSNQRLDQALVKLFPNYSRSQIKKWILDDKVYVNGKIVNKPKKKVSGSELISINVMLEENICWRPEDIPLNIIYEDEDILIINKPRNLIVHPSISNSNLTILNALLYRYPEIVSVPRTGIVHRLDKDTTGLMVIAKTITAQINLVESLKQKKITREYEALVNGSMITGGIISKPIARHPIKRTRMVVHPNGKTAITYYQVIERFKHHTRIKLQLKTGRTHQIRVHMAYINHHLIGDPIYGNYSKSLKGISNQFRYIINNFNRQALHATMLRLYHPNTGIEMEWHADIPTDMVVLIDMLRANTMINKNKID